jgi:hypothetical protein
LIQGGQERLVSLTPGEEEKDKEFVINTDRHCKVVDSNDSNIRFHREITVLVNTLAVDTTIG